MRWHTAAIYDIIQMVFGGGAAAGIVEVCAAMRHRKADNGITDWNI